MVLIPAGCFQMGDAFAEGAENELPVHRVCVDAFYMDQYEVTNAQYRRYKPDHSSGGRGRLDRDGDDQPVVWVNWWDAIRYCNWRSRQEGLQAVYDEQSGEANFSRNGYRLPTEAEWEYAARGGVEGQRYVWGNGPPPPRAANVADETARQVWGWSDIFFGYDDGYAVSAPVGSFMPNGYGLYDMAGNVWEWCHDWYAMDYYSWSPERNPRGPASGEDRLMRGGSWVSYPSNTRIALRYWSTPTYAWYNNGFRCVRAAR
jgi:formylglycine-generating enzyme